MKRSERKVVLSLALLYVMRMLGLFMILPVLSILGQSLDGANSFLIGVAIGAYGLSQSVFQIPFGLLSDRIGRKTVIVGGLFLFALGSAVAAMSDSIYGVIAGRFLQGAGAIASVLMALLSDLTTEQSRTRAMAVIGMSIGLSFSVALVLGPIVSSWIGLSGLFWLIAMMAILGIAIVLWVVPTPTQASHNLDAMPAISMIGAALSNPELRRLDFGIMVLHMTLTAMFVAVPLTLTEKLGIAKSEHWWIYLCVMGLSFFAMIPFIILAEKRRKMKVVFLSAIGLAATACFLLATFNETLPKLMFGLFLFFMAFNLLEASLPSLVSKTAPAGAKGTAMGVYSTFQFFGAFIGGAAGGLMYHHYGMEGVYYFCGGVIIVWLLYAATMRPPSYSTSIVVSLNGVTSQKEADQLARELLAIYGVEDVVTILDDHVAYLKVDKGRFDVSEARHYAPFASGKCILEA